MGNVEFKNKLFVIFHKKIIFDHVTILTRPNHKRYFGGSYQSLCLLLDNVPAECTANDFDIDPGKV